MVHVNVNQSAQVGKQVKMKNLHDSLPQSETMRERERESMSLDMHMHGIYTFARYSAINNCSRW